MNMTLQPYAQPGLNLFPHSISFIPIRNNTNNYATQISMLSNSILPMINETEKKFEIDYPESTSTNKKSGENSTMKNENPIFNTKKKGKNNFRYQARLGCLRHVERRERLPESTIAVDIEYMDPKTVTRNNINDRNEDGLTPLMRVAVDGGNVEDISALLKKGAKIDLQDESDNTALMWVVKSLFRLANAARIESKLKILDCLIKQNADVDLADREGFTPLMIAAMGNDEKSFKKLFNIGAKVELTNNYGETALHLAIKYNASCIIIEQLSMFYRKMDFKDNNGHTPFMIAAFRGKLDIMSSFFNKGISIDEADAKGWTALMHAVNCRNEEVVNNLLKYGAKVNFTNSRNKSALTIAFAKKDKKMTLVLMKAGVVTADVKMNSWLKSALKENEISNIPAGVAVANGNNMNSTDSSTNITDIKVDFIAVNPTPELNLSGDNETESNSSNSGVSAHFIPQWIINKMKELYEAFRRVASPISPL